MTCPTKQFGCSCKPGECQTPNYELLKTANVSIRGPLLTLLFITVVVIWALLPAALATVRTYPHLIQDQSR